MFLDYAPKKLKDKVLFPCMQSPILTLSVAACRFHPKQKLGCVSNSREINQNCLAAKLCTVLWDDPAWTGGDTR